MKFFISYRLLGYWVKLNVLGMEKMLQALLLFQIIVTTSFLGASFLSPQSITLNITSYILL